MNMIVIFSLALALAHPENSVSTMTEPPVSGATKITQNDTNPALPDIDPIITGVPRSDSLSDWEKRRQERQDCDPCTEMNPYPLDLDE